MGLTIGGGSGHLVNNNREGGGLFNEGDTTLINCTITLNVARDGGGISNRGEMTIQDSFVRENTATSEGGGIANKDRQRDTILLPAGPTQRPGAIGSPPTAC